jgi:hypothetical protein
MSSRALFAGAGCSVLVTLSYTAALLSPTHFVIYFFLFPLSNIFLATLLNVVGISLLAALLWSLIERVNRRSFLWLVVFAGIITLEVYCLSKFFWSSSRRSALDVAVGTLILAFVVRGWKPAWFKWLADGAYVSLAILGFSILFVVPELAYLAYCTRGQETWGFDHPKQLASADGPRIVWIIFDELSEEQLYDHRTAGLALPNFDRLRAESIEFSNLEPAGYFTRLVIPSILSGRYASKMRSTSHGNLELYFSDTRGWEPFDASRSIFATARNLGWTTGVVGWDIPYCRLLAGSVDSCYWSNQYPIIDGSDMDPRLGAFTNASLPLLKWMHAVVPDKKSQIGYYEKNWVLPQTRDYHSVMEHALALARDPAIRFKFIHLPIPHQPPIYDRKTRAFTGQGSYLDNLALADVALGQLLDVLTNSPKWSKTTLIVGGDHSWRLAEWRPHQWTAEDQAASKGLFDTRPALVVHISGELDAYKSTLKSQAMAEYDLVVALLQSTVHSSDDVIARISHSRQLLNSAAR